MVRNHSLFRTESAYEEAEIKGPWKTGSLPWPLLSIQIFMTARGRPPSLCSATTTNYPVLFWVYCPLKSSLFNIDYYLTNSPRTCQVFLNLLILLQLGFIPSKLQYISFNDLTTN